MPALSRDDVIDDVIMSVEMQLSLQELLLFETHRWKQHSDLKNVNTDGYL